MDDNRFWAKFVIQDEDNQIVESYNVLAEYEYDSLNDSVIWSVLDPYEIVFKDAKKKGEYVGRLFVDDIPVAKFWSGYVYKGQDVTFSFNNYCQCCGQKKKP